MTTATTRFKAKALELETWCRTAALPFWAKAATHPTGGIYEELFLSGEPNLESTRRVRVQARHCYVYAHASAMNWFDGEAISDHAWQYLTTNGFQGGDNIDGFKGCAHLLNPDGSLNDGLRDTYAQAFVMLAGAWRYIAFDDEKALQTAKDTLKFLDDNLAADNGGWYEGIPASLPRRQNPHMHLFEALIALYDATEDRYYLDRAGQMYDLFTRHFFHESSGSLLEFFTEDWTPKTWDKGINGGPIEPGHMMEWCWLLYCYAERADKDLSSIADRLYDGAIKTGETGPLGLLCDEHGTSKAESCRTWPQTEYIKASVARASALPSGPEQDKLLDTTSRVIDLMVKTYMNVEIKGGWIDKVKPDGTVIAPIMPTSTFYHIICAATETSNLARNL